MLDLVLPSLHKTCLIWTFIFSLDGSLVDLALSWSNMTCLILDQCGVELTLLSLFGACLVYTPWMEWCECGLDKHFSYTSTPSFRRNRMNLVSRDLVLFHFSLKRLTVQELKYSARRVSLLKVSTLYFDVSGGLILIFWTCPWLLFLSWTK